MTGPLDATRRPDVTGRPDVTMPLGVTMLFPTQPPELVQEMVLVAHTNATRMRQLVGRQATLAKAAWDWGFGDWETALGAASHMGNREIAEILLGHGAHPTIFSAAMLGQLDVVRAFVSAAPGIQRTKGPHSITLLAHAKAGGARAQQVVDYLKSIGDEHDGPELQPLSDDDASRLTGTYTFGVTPADRLEISMNGTGLQLTRPGHFGRGLYHLGGREFYPMGAEDVRVRFAESAGVMTLTIFDPEPVLTARRRA